MNLWTGLSNPPQHRPGDATDEKPVRVRSKRIAKPPANPRPGSDLPDVPNPWGLNRGEARAQQLRADGKTTKQIASEIGVTPKTVECYYKGARAKMGCSSFRCAVLWDRFVRGDWIPEATQ